MHAEGDVDGLTSVLEGRFGRVNDHMLMVTIKALGKVRQEKGVQPLLRILLDKEGLVHSAQVRVVAGRTLTALARKGVGLKALGQTGDLEALSLLLRVIGEPSWRAVFQDEVVEPGSLESTTWRIRSRAADAITELAEELKENPAQYHELSQQAALPLIKATIKYQKESKKIDSASAQAEVNDQIAFRKALGNLEPTAVMAVYNSTLLKKKLSLRLYAAKAMGKLDMAWLAKVKPEQIMEAERRLLAVAKLEGEGKDMRWAVLKALKRLNDYEKR